MNGTLEPATVAEAAELFRQATREGRTVSIDRPGGDLVLSTARLDRVLEHEAGDLTVTLEAGVRLSALNARLAEKGQMLALDPPGDPTVGACLAANLSGPRRHRYGAPRDLVLGATVVLADGTVASSGGKVVKNVAGYDIAKLFCGSGGRYGLLARLSFRLHPLPAAAASLVALLDEAGEARARSQLVQASQLVPSALDLLWQGPGSRLQTLFEGSSRAVAAQLAEARSLVGGDEAGDEVWDEARAWQSRAEGRISFAPGELAQTLGAVDRGLVRPGIGTAYPMERLADDDRAGARLLAERVRAALDPQGVLA